MIYLNSEDRGTSQEHISLASVILALDFVFIWKEVKAVSVLSRITTKPGHSTLAAVRSHFTQDGWNVIDVLASGLVMMTTTITIWLATDDDARRQRGPRGRQKGALHDTAITP